jgi:hypothetical protein
MFKPLSGAVNGANACLFLERDTILEGEGEGEASEAEVSSFSCEYAGRLSESSERLAVDGCIT